ncbi:MAG: helix-turn-helix transcriptional regulator [Oribacterium sp.]|nr:helix-turn-helix transcriptional regulator [Oribacterium sp.]
MGRTSDYKNNSDIKNIFYIKKYGKVHVHLAEILDQKHMTRNALARATDTRFEVVKKWYNDSITTIDLDVLARFCYVLNCQPEDLIKYQVDP